MKSSYSTSIVLFLFVGLLIAPYSCEVVDNSTAKPALSDETTKPTAAPVPITTLKPGNETTPDPKTTTSPTTTSTQAPETTTKTPETTTKSSDTTTSVTPDNSTTTTTTSSTTTTTQKTTTPTTTTEPTTTTTTMAPNSTTTTAVPDTTTAAPNTTTVAPSPAPKPGPITPCGHFDGPSFIGGIVLTLGLLAIGLVAYKFYKARNERNYHTL